MKRLLLVLCVLLSLPVLADTRTKTFTFDFSNPETLLPTGVTRNPDNGGGVVEITDKVFTSSDDCISIRFDISNVSGLYPIYLVSVGSQCHLRLRTSAELIIEASNDIKIKSVRFPGSDVVGGVNLIRIGSTEVFEFLALNADQSYYIWSNDNSRSFSSLTFANKVPGQTQSRDVRAFRDQGNRKEGTDQRHV